MYVFPQKEATETVSKGNLAVRDRILYIIAYFRVVSIIDGAGT